MKKRKKPKAGYKKSNIILVLKSCQTCAEHNFPKIALFMFPQNGILF